MVTTVVSSLLKTRVLFGNVPDEQQRTFSATAVVRRRSGSLIKRNGAHEGKVGMLVLASLQHLLLFWVFVVVQIGVVCRSWTTYLPEVSAVGAAGARPLPASLLVSPSSVLCEPGTISAFRNSENIPCCGESEC